MDIVCVASETAYVGQVEFNLLVLFSKLFNDSKNGFSGLRSIHIWHAEIEQNEFVLWGSSANNAFQSFTNHFDGDLAADCTVAKDSHAGDLSLQGENVEALVVDN